MSKIGELHKLISLCRVENSVIRKVDVHTDKDATLAISLFLGSQSDFDRQFTIRFGVKNFTTNKGEESLFGYFVYRLLQITEVEQFSDLIGKYARIYINPNGLVIGIAHILKNDYLFPVLEIEN